MIRSTKVDRLSTNLAAIDWVGGRWFIRYTAVRDIARGGGILLFLFIFVPIELLRLCIEKYLRLVGKHPDQPKEREIAAIMRRADSVLAKSELHAHVRKQYALGIIDLSASIVRHDAIKETGRDPGPTQEPESDEFYEEGDKYK